jgi:uncharacterized protein YraI
LVPRAVLDRWLAHDARGAYDAAVSQAGQLRVTSQDFINALGSVNFQLGTHWNHTFTHSWSLMMSHQWETAAQEVAKSAWARQTPVRVHDFQAALRALIGGHTGGGNNGGGHTGGDHTGGGTTPQPPLGTPTGTGVVTGDNVNVRSGPGTNHQTVGNQLDRGAHVSIYERRDGWLRIGQGRWVKGEFVHVNVAAPQPISTGTISGDNVNVRNGPGTSHQTVGNQLDRGAHVSIFEAGSASAQAAGSRPPTSTRQARAIPIRPRTTIHHPPTAVARTILRRAGNTIRLGGSTTRPAMVAIA